LKVDRAGERQHYPSPMTDRTLQRLAVIAVLALAGCSSADTDISAEAPLPDVSGWRLSSGKTPTKAEFTALAASCQDRGGAFDDCLTDLGLKRLP
jgi:hypothetical protein